jgi:formate dehydrogenase subunit gamma
MTVTQANPDARGLAAAHHPAGVGPQGPVHETGSPTEPVVVDRYTVMARINHWITAISFVLLVLSGLALFYPTLYFLTGLFGGGANTRAIHPWIGIVLIIAFFGLFLRFWRYNLWERSDSVWLSRIRDVLGARDDDLPELGKYNAGQKIVFWSMSCLLLVSLATGLVIWDQYFSQYTSIDQKRLAVLGHALAAIAMICVWIMHLHGAAWVRGTVRGMTRGTVTGGWAWRYHRRWLRDMVGGKSDDRSAGPAPAE